MTKVNQEMIVTFIGR